MLFWITKIYCCYNIHNYNAYNKCLDDTVCHSNFYYYLHKTMLSHIICSSSIKSRQTDAIQCTENTLYTIPPYSFGKYFLFKQWIESSENRSNQFKIPISPLILSHSHPISPPDQGRMIVISHHIESIVELWIHKVYAINYITGCPEIFDKIQP